MFSRAVLLFSIVLVQASFIRTEDDIASSPYLESIQSETFGQLSSYVQVSWNETAADRQNVYFFPMLMRIRRSTILMKLFHGDGLVQHFPPDSYLQNAHELARIRDRLEQAPMIGVKFKMALFYDPRYLSKQYVNELKSYYHPEMYEIHLERNNKRSLTWLIDSWTRNNTKGGVRKTENYRWTAADNSYHANIFSFTGCWDTPKNYLESIATNLRRRRFVPTMPRFTKLNITLITEIVDVQAFSATERIGYFDNSEKHYEAIKLPFRNSDFAMALVLPYETHTSEIFATFQEEDYRQLFRHLKENYENINYTVPIINSTEFLINEEGVSVNGGDLCGWSLVSGNRMNEVTFKPFRVSRPFGIFIYHEKTSLILMYGLMRNIASNSWLMAGS